MPPAANTPNPQTAHTLRWCDRPRQRAGKLAVIAAGAGPRVVLLHGVGLRAEAWNPVIDALSQRFEVIAPDIPGHGDSPESALPDPDGSRALSAYAEALLPLLDRPAFVLGHSMGALLALDLAARFPEKMLGVAALNAVFERDKAATAAVQARAAQLDGKNRPDPDPTLTRWFGAAQSPERAACEHWLRSVNPAGYRRAYTTFAHDPGPQRADLAKLACPALFMTGAEEPNSTPAMSRDMAACAPRGRCVIVEGAAHMMPMTNDAEVIAALTDLFGEAKE
jgi:pimeloyl-ACP methyl ester carboxylesterase